MKKTSKKRGLKVPRKPKDEPAWPADEIVRRPVKELIPYARNARVHPPEQIAQVAASIREFGWTMPVLVDEEGTLIAGHCRIEAANQLGIEVVPVMVARGWSQAKRRAYILADNKLTLNGSWDSDMLRVELSDLDLEGFDLALTGFAKFETDSILSDPDFEPSDEDPARLDQKKRIECPHCGEEFTPE